MIELVVIVVVIALLSGIFVRTGRGHQGPRALSCPSCRGRMHPRATICPHCGRESRVEYGFPWARRVAVSPSSSSSIR